MEVNRNRIGYIALHRIKGQAFNEIHESNLKREVHESNLRREVHESNSKCFFCMGIKPKEISLEATGN